jgi:CDK-activating kinase assembly factor MAT1
MRGDKAKAQEIRERTDREKAARVEALARAVPPSLTNLSSSTNDQDDLDPLSAGYNGPYVAIPYSDPAQAAWTGWYDLRPDYMDGREGVWSVKEGKDGKVRGGGYDLSLFWEMEIRSAVEGLGIEPMS